MRRGETPPRIASWPTEIRSIGLPSGPLELVAVRGLETLLDRDRLLADAGMEPPYWTLLWSGAALLAAFLDRREDLAGRTLFDAGCGLELVTLAAARRGARVSAVDRNPDAVAFARVSAARLGLEVQIAVGDIGEYSEGRRFDWIAAAELLYEREDFARLASAFARSLAPGGRLVIADARRVRTEAFYEELERRGLAREAEEETRVDEEGTLVRVCLSTWMARRG